MKFNKIAACLIATACTATTLGAVSSVSAASDFSVSAGTASVAAGETFKVDIKLENVPASGIAGLDFAIKYDSSVIDITGCSEGAVSKTNDIQPEGFTSNLVTDINSSTGMVSVLWATGQIDTNASWIKSDGVLLTIEGKALKNGVSNLEIVKGVRADAVSVDAVVEGLKVVNPSVSAGSVTVADKTVATTTEKDVTPSSKLYGDVDLNGKVELNDITALSLYLVGSKTLSEEAKELANVQYDDAVNLADLALLKQYICKDSVKLGK